MEIGDFGQKFEIAYIHSSLQYYWKKRFSLIQQLI